MSIIIEKEKVKAEWCLLPDRVPTSKLEIRHAHHDMLRRCRCKRMERNYLRWKKKEVSEV